jgi:hypothetical protein
MTDQERAAAIFAEISDYNDRQAFCCGPDHLEYKGLGEKIRECIADALAEVREEERAKARGEDEETRQRRAAAEAKRAAVETLRSLAERIESGEIYHWEISVSSPPGPSWGEATLYPTPSSKHTVTLDYIDPKP